MLDKNNLVKELKPLGLKNGDLLYLKVSMQSIGEIEGGAESLISAILELIGKKGTLVVSSFLKAYPINYLKRHKNIINSENSQSYAGLVANALMKHPDAIISKHPVQKFTAVGDKALTLLQDHDQYAYAYDVFRKMAEQGGKTLKIGDDDKVKGVGTTHVAIGLLGLKQKRPPLGARFINELGEKELFYLNWAGLCQGTFKNFTASYKETPGAIISEVKVGEAPAKLTDMKLTLEVELDKITRNPEMVLCGDKDCFHCALTWEFSKRKPLEYFLSNLVRCKFKNVLYFLKNYHKSEWQSSKDQEPLTFLGKNYRIDLEQ